MEQWYRDLLAGGTEQAHAALTHDYAPHAGFLGSLSGRVLDVGGGAGLTARYLASECDYWVIDPAAVWREPEWREFGGDYRSGRQVRFVEGTGENLPFPDESFDSALAFWTLNHTADPARCVGEMARVVRPGGLVYLVLEDMVPSWKDVAPFVAGRLAARLGLRYGSAGWGQPGLNSVRQTLIAKAHREWPVQDDHLPIAEAELRRSFTPRLLIRDRRWLGGFLTFELQRHRR